MACRTGSKGPCRWARLPGRSVRSGHGQRSAAFVVDDGVAAAARARAAASSRWRARSWPTACPAATTGGWPTRSRTPCAPAARCPRPWPSSTGSSGWGCRRAELDRLCLAGRRAQAQQPGPRRRGRARADRRDDGRLDRGAGPPARASGSSRPAVSAGCTAGGGDLRHLGRPRGPRDDAGPRGLRGGEVDPRRPRHVGTAGDAVGPRPGVPHRPVPGVLPHRLRLGRPVAGESAAEAAAVAYARAWLGTDAAGRRPGEPAARGAPGRPGPPRPPRRGRTGRARPGGRPRQGRHAPPVEYFHEHSDGRACAPTSSWSSPTPPWPPRWPSRWRRSARRA